ncbi:alpha/beta hydrolase [Amycolatopsis dendrobii]|uniref:Alpha/beta hydrolase n=1 Tax=Amycolatopsis dendrobii TaxID=2760662 RepID=A0A7W3VZE9_9PSEU|nr:alpha/beta hydrolase [Amycolatopsis dendrobii]MBB1155527.1 alpha/beta hydrolase [Amycolatopsis dendrobii]
MSEPAAPTRPPEPDFSTITPAGLLAYREAENRFRASSAAYPIIGEPTPDAVLEWREITLPSRELPVRVYRPRSEAVLPLVIHVHGGGFVGTAAQCDWTNSHLAARLPAVVVSVEHRLLAPDSALANAAADGWDVLENVVRQASAWGIDPTRVAIFGESCGALISALTAVRAKKTGLKLRAQVLVNPVADVTETMFEYPSITEYAYSPSRALPLLQLFQRLAVPPGADARSVSPLHATNLHGLAPALVVVPTQDAVADHGRRYAERLREGGTSVQLTEYPGAKHAFLTLPGLEPQAKAAQAEILAFLHAALAK